MIKKEDVRVGDEIIISNHSLLKYLKVLALPKKGGGTFKCSMQDWNYSGPQRTPCQSDISKHDRTVYQNLYARDIWLVKREDY